MEKKTYYAVICAFVFGFAIGFPTGYSTVHKHNALQNNKSLSDSKNTINAAVEAKSSSEKEESDLYTEFKKKNTHFSVPAVEGGEINLADFGGKPVLFMFYTQDCPYCIKAAPALEKAHKEYAEKGLVVLGLCTESEKEAAVNFAAKQKTTFAMGYDARDAFRKYGAQGVPFIYLLDKNHEIVAVWPGYSAAFDSLIKEAVENVI